MLLLVGVPHMASESDPELYDGEMVQSCESRECMAVLCSVKDGIRLRCRVSG